MTAQRQRDSQRLNSFSGGGGAPYASIVHIDGFELGEGWVRLAMWLTSASPGGFHDWKTLYQDRHRFYMWLHTYLDEAKLHYCSPTVPLLQVKNNADPIYSKKQQ